MPRGVVGFYHRYKENKGAKVFYSFKNNSVCSKKYVSGQFRKHRKLYELGVAPKPHKIITVELDFDRYNKKGELERHVKKKAFGIVADHVHYPEDAWAKYAAGINYDFDCLDKKEHPKHCPEGYLKFCKKMKKILLAAKMTVCGEWPVKEKKNPKLGDIVYDTRKKRFYLVDVG